MTIENDVLREDFRAWMKSPEIGLPEYSTDLQIQRRVGNIITGGARCLSHVQRKSAVPFETDSPAVENFRCS
jgi:hypothetical protein